MLAIPALFVSSALGGLWIVAAILTWFVGALPRPARRGACATCSCTCSATTRSSYAYVYLVTDAYPHASPLEGAEPAEVPVVPAFDLA